MKNLVYVATTDLFYVDCKLTAAVAPFDERRVGPVNIESFMY